MGSRKDKQGYFTQGLGLREKICFIKIFGVKIFKFAWMGLDGDSNIPYQDIMGDFIIIIVFLQWTYEKG